ncbi:hypothetical protein [Terrisporobacter mayombei]|uniref:Lipoprotein n=1 Tax=Terrisporobacter mayombei TaxID=1541 RepID=A0ABY9PZ70_9FIRM|nr:hypothetical protein [Terrisporobacter mayombei]MCC3868338.1 hypothetical protein [Terrisporobacter mayombei]WMT80479.1 hypothetical protein TEMA_07960 [Terrisporobacter mayombei]
MNKKILSFIIALSLPLAFLVGCNKSKDEEFVMTEDTKALDGSVEYSAKTYKDAFYSTENYSDEYLQKEFETIVKEITSKEDKEALVELLKSYSSSQDGSLDLVKSCFEKYGNQSGNSQDVTLDSNGMHEISTRLYKATLNATKKYYDINDFYIYYKDKLSASSSSKDDDFENEVKMTTIKEYTIANIYKNAYNDSFISKIITSIEKPSSSDEAKNDTTENVTKPETNKPVVDNNNSNNSNNNSNNNNNNNSDDTYPEYLELSEAVKSQIYDAGVNAAIEYIGQNISTSSSSYCRETYDALENDNPLGKNKEEGYKSFLEGFKTTLENNKVDFK